MIEAGAEYGPTRWLELVQERIDRFADATDDDRSIHVGLNRVRFPGPVPVGSRIRGRFRVDSVDDVPGGRQATVAATIEREGAEKPVCVAELVVRMLA